MKIVYFAKNIQNYKEITCTAQDNIYSLDSKTSEYLSKLSLNFKEIKETITIEENKDIELKVMKITLEWYNQKEIKNYLLINEINLGFLVELELYSFLLDIVRNIKIIEKIILHEKPDKLIGLGNVNHLEFIAKKFNLTYEIKNKKNVSSEFGMDKFHIRYDIFNHPIGITLSHQKYISLREKFEKLTYHILKIIKNNKKCNENFLLLEFNPVIFSDLLNSAKKFNKKLNLLNLRRPVIWNIDSFKIIKNSNSEIIIAGNYLKNKKTVELEINELDSNLKRLFEKEIILEKEFLIDQDTYWPVIKDHMKIFLKSRGMQAIKEYHIATNLFETNNFKVVLGLNDNLQVEKTILTVAKQKGIPTLILQHGIFDNRSSKDSPYIRMNAVLPLVAEYFLIWGKIVENYALKEGWNPVFISDVGSPKFDHLFNKSKNKKRTKKILLATSSGQFLDYESYRRYKESIKQTCKIVQNLKGYELQVKVHPYEQEFSMIQEVIKEVDPKIPIRINADLDEMIESSDVIITFNLSTVILHSLIAQKPTIVSWILHNEIPDEEIFRYGGIVLTQYENLEMELKKILEDEIHRENLIKNGNMLITNYFSNQGNASEKLLEFMSKL